MMWLPAYITYFIVLVAGSYHIAMVWPGIGDPPWKSIIRADIGAAIAIAIVWLTWRHFA